MLFKRMSNSVRPVPAMIRAVDTLQQAGEMENNHSVTTLQEETSQSLQFLNHWRKVSLRNYVYRQGPFILITQNVLSTNSTKLQRFSLERL